MGRLRIVLEQVRVASPCNETWDSMSGDDRVRHCARCDLDVFNLSAMARDEAEALLAENLGTGARLCGGGIERDDGSFLTGDCPTGYQANQLRFAGAAS